MTCHLTGLEKGYRDAMITESTCAHMTIAEEAIGPESEQLESIVKKLLD
jgi:hypothetical protein